MLLCVDHKRERFVILSQHGAHFALHVVVLFGSFGELLKPAGLGWIGGRLVVFEFAEACGILHGVVERTEAIDQSVFQSLVTRPHAALPQSVDIGQGHLTACNGATIGHTRHKEFVAAIDMALQRSSFGRIEGTTHTIKVGTFVGFDHVKVEAELLGEQFGGIGDHTKDADGTGQCGRFGKDVVGPAGHIVAARCRHTAHRHNHGLFLLEQLDGAPHLLTGIGAAAPRIDAQHNGFHVFVVGQSIQIAHHLRTDNLLRRAHHGACAGDIDNRPFGIVDGHFVVGTLRLGRQGQLGGRDKFRSDTAHALAQHIPHLIHIGQFVHQTEALIVCRVGKSHIAVGIGIESVHRQAARLSHGSHHPLPNV